MPVKLKISLEEELIIKFFSQKNNYDYNLIKYLLKSLLKY